ncbi:MAG: hypothetical protein PVF63_06800 [Gammaproteobacteria bacterium]|jgi:hypothetical protein
MLKRLSFAFLGACLVTVVLILGMSEIAQFFERPDSQLYMRVMDFIPGSGARRLPEKRMPEAQPERARVDLEVGATRSSPAPLTFDDAAQPLDVRLELDRLPEDPP